MARAEALVLCVVEAVVVAEEEPLAVGVASAVPVPPPPPLMFSPPRPPGEGEADWLTLGLRVTEPLSLAVGRAESVSEVVAVRARPHTSTCAAVSTRRSTANSCPSSVSSPAVTTFSSVQRVEA